MNDSKTSNSGNSNNNQSSSSGGSNNRLTGLSSGLGGQSGNIGAGHVIHTNSSQETCLICGDVASGKHYGLRSCEACKAFFKRTVQGKIEYSCPATRECEINKRRRKACQACRFQKCLNMGMLKEGVRLDRVRGGRQKYRRGQSPTGTSGVGGINSGLLVTNTNSANGLGFLDVNGSSSNCLTIGGSGGALINSGPNGAQANSSTSFSLFGCAPNLGTAEANKIITALINCEPHEISASPAQFVTNIPSTLSIQMKTLYILSDLFDRELVLLIGWAKQIPGFSENITLNDQMRLLQSTWAEVIALSIGYRSHMKRLENSRQQQQHHGGGIGAAAMYLNATPSPTSSSPASTTSSYNNNGNHSLANSNSLDNSEIRLVFAKDLVLDFKHAVACGAEEIFYNCVQLVKRLDHLKITPKEYIILKAICLTNADVKLENPSATHQLRDLIMETLYEATISDSSSTIPTTANTTTSQTNSNHSPSASASSSTNVINHVSSIQNIFGQQKDTTNDPSTSSGISGSTRIKTETQERPLSSMNQYSSTAASPSRPSSSIPSSSSLSSISSHNNNNNNASNSNNTTVNNNNTASLDANNSANNINSRAIINHRLNQVLLCLPVLRQIDTCIRKFWNDVRKSPANVPMNKLFEEMLDTNQRNYKSSTDM